MSGSSSWTGGAPVDWSLQGFGPHSNEDDDTDEDEHDDANSTNSSSALSDDESPPEELDWPDFASKNSSSAQVPTAQNLSLP